MELEWIVGKCLAKEREERYQHVSELLVDLRGLRRKLESGKSSKLVTKPEPSPQALPRWKLASLIAIVALSGVVIGLTPWALGPDPEPRGSELPELRFSFPVSDVPSWTSSRSTVEVSPDGRQIAYASKAALS
jgi:hypothetical protein